MSRSFIGQSVPRKEGRAKLTGKAKYIDDLSLPNMIHGITVRSSIPRGRIKSITFDPGPRWEEFTIVSAKDILGKNYVALILQDQPFLADQVVNHSEEAILLLAHPNKYLLEEARQHVRIEMEPLAAILSLEESSQRKEVIWGKDNILKSFYFQLLINRCLSLHLETVCETKREEVLSP